MGGTSQRGDGGDVSQTTPDTGNDFLIVGIGASAGGIKALQDFFANVTAESGMAYVVILHLSPKHESQLAEVLQNVAVIPVTQVEDRVRVVPNHVYVIPPNQSLAMEDGHLALSDITRFEERRAPIDIFFRTLAETHTSRAVTVVLSGTGADGSMGMKRVKERGGIAIVQDPQEAEYGDMPRNSMATNLVDYVLPVKQIPARLMAFRDQRGRIRSPAETTGDTETNESALRQIFTTMRVRTGHDFTNYKRSTISRRIERRMSVHELLDLQSYADFLREHESEPQSLLKDLLISVTNFFRDRKAFETLERDIIPKIFENKNANDQVRIWVAGCATGEEAYSVAMLLAEHVEGSMDAPELQIFATDIDEDAIAFAREGFYTLNDAADVSPERLRRFFVEEGKGFRVQRELREMVLFAHHNVIRDPPFSHLDLISCRNLLIYLNRTAQSRVMGLLNFALNPGGYLFLGGSEAVEGASDLFVVADKEHHIFQSRALSGRAQFLSSNVTTPQRDAPIIGAGLFPERASSALSSQSRSGRLPPLQNQTSEQSRFQAQERITYADLHQRLLEQYAPPSIVVNEDYDIVHLSERAGRYLLVTGGEPSHNLLKLIRPELRLELRTALYQAVQRRANIEARGLRVRFDGDDDKPRSLNLTVRPVLREDDTARGFFLVLIEEDHEAAAALETEVPATELLAGGIEPIARRLEEELMRVKAQLRATAEHGELQTEELKASNEELQAVNEELRSAAEELETGKEELQSVNEELFTVNQELKIKIEELGQSNDDISNLINSTDIGTLFLDHTFRIKFYTPRVADIFKLIPADVGRPLTDIRSKLVNANIVSDVELVLDQLDTIEREVETDNGRVYLMQISPYLATENRINGVILTFVNITARKSNEEELRASAARLAQQTRIFKTLSSIRDFAYSFDLDGRFIYANEPLLNLLGLMFDEIVGKKFYELPYPKELADRLQGQIRRVIETKEIVVDETPYVSPAGVNGYYEYIFTPVLGTDGGVEAVAGSTRDTTERRLAEERLRESEERFRAMFEQASVGIVQVNIAGQMVAPNPGFCKLIGYTEEEARRLRVRDVTHPDDYPEEAELTRRLINGDIPSFSIEKRFIRKDGSIVWGAMTATLVHHASREPFYALSIVEDISERKAAEAGLLRAHQELETKVEERTRELAASNSSLLTEMAEHKQSQKARVKLLHQLVTTQEDERRRIARDLHDHLGQQLTALRLKIAALKDSCGKDEKLCEQAEEAQELAAQLDADVDFLAWELRPAGLDDLGLTLALNNYVREWSLHFNTAVEFHSSNLTDVRLAPEIETNLYRITQEALNNTFKHAQASRVDVLLERRDHHVVLIIEDDGIGFDTTQKSGLDPNGKGNSDSGLGLAGMRERAALLGGTIQIESDLGAGTTIFARIPIALATDES